MLLSAAIVTVISVLGGMNGIDGLPDEGTFFQKSVAVASIIYALLGIGAGVGVLLRKRWSLTLAILWGVVVTYTGTVASVAWAERGQPIMASLVLALLICVVVCGLVIWGVHIATDYADINRLEPR